MHNESPNPKDSASSGASFLTPSPEILSKIQLLYEAGLCLQAYRAGECLGPLKQWRGAPAQVLAGRLANNIGGYQLGRVLHWLAWRTDKHNPDFLAYHGYGLLQRRGPLATLEFFERYEAKMQAADADAQMHLLSLRAMVTAQMRDFRASWDLLARAAALAPTNPWLPTTRAHVLELEDRYPESLEAAQEALRLRPWYRPGVQAMGHALQLLDRDEEALEFLTEAVRHTENMHVVRQLAALQMELRLYPVAAASLALFTELAPLMEEAEREWLRRQQITLDCLRENRQAALSGARQIEEPYYRELADRLEGGGEFRRVRLEVPFVRQHHMTCGPATLSAISRYWQQPANHLEVAEAICYDGTPAQSERNWADSNGWVTREFTVTWEAAVALLDRGIPFTLTTVGAASGHLQAVVGYDEMRQTLWIRDPFVYVTHEFCIKPLLEQQRSNGPRGMALVPQSRRELLDGLDLPEADLYDQFYRAQCALARHDRVEAQNALHGMEASAPTHRLSLTARRVLAAYDGNRPVLLECLGQLLQQFPEDVNLNLARLSCLAELARRGERLRLLEGLCSRRNTDPVFWQQYAQELRADAREHRAAVSWVRWALRYRPTDPVLVASWADLLWDQREFEQATPYYRLAACLGDKRETFAQRYFIALRHLRQTEAGLEFLRQREARLGRQSSDPAITLVESLQHLRRSNGALQVLEAALTRRPEDGGLRLFAADFYGRFSQFERAEKLLTEARSRCPAVTWHRAAATLAGYQNKKQLALQHWREVLQLEPLSHEAIRASALLLAETEGRAAAHRFLTQLCERFPYSCPLLALRVRWLQDDGASEVIPHLREMLEVNPTDAWARRELALKLAANGEEAEALEAVAEAIRLEPFQSTGYAVRGEIHARRGRSAEAHADFRQAVRLEVDNEYAVTRFVDSGATLAERKQALGEVAEELRHQVIFSDALAAYQTAARGLLAPAEVLSLLREAHAARPDLWQAWSVLVHQLVDMGQHEEARKQALEATARFPLLPRLWVDLARVEQARLDAPGEIAALEKALELSPGYAYASRQLASLYERQHELAKARMVLEAAVAANPLEAYNHGGLAHMLWLQGERDQAIARLQQALRLEPGFDWGWRALRDWGQQVGQAGLAVEMARELTRCRAGEVRSWLLLAECLEPEKDAEALFDALDHALGLNPRSVEAYDIKARALARLNRFEEAFAQCAPPALQPPPAQLQIRAAWIEAQRGNLKGAIERAQAALKDAPDYYGGWQLLADWQVENQQLDEASEAAQRMAELAPLEAVPLGYLGSLKLRLGERKAARAAFERAFTLDPDYEYAGYQLFRMQLEGSEHEGAETTLQVLRRRGENHRTLSGGVELAAARRDPSRALDLFRKLCAAKDAEPWTLNPAAKVLDVQGHRKETDRILEHQLDSSDCSPGLAQFWVERQVGRKHWSLHKRLTALQAGGQSGRQALLGYLELMGQAFSEAKKKGDVTTPLVLRFHLWRLLKRHQDWLQNDVEGWGKVGYVLTCIGRPKPVIAWLGDWKHRPKAESWMLYNLVVMLQQQKRYEESREIIRHAVALRHGEDLYEAFCLWAAFEEALLGNAKQAKEHLASMPAKHTRDHLRPVLVMTQLLLSRAGAGPGGKSARAQMIRQQLQAAFGKKTPSRADRYVRNAYLRFIRAASRDSASLWWWGWWNYRRERWLWVPALVVLIPMAMVAPPLLIVLAVMALRRAQRD